MNQTYTVAVNNAKEIVRHYPYNDEGYNAAYVHARKFNYEIWESFNGIPRYLNRSSREG